MPVLVARDMLFKYEGCAEMRAHVEVPNEVRSPVTPYRPHHVHKDLVLPW